MDGRLTGFAKRHILMYMYFQSVFEVSTAFLNLVSALTYFRLAKTITANYCLFCFK